MQTLSYQLLGVLADGQFHTGEALGARFGVSKTSVWKAIGDFAALGLEVHSVRGKGYRLSEKLCLLDAAHIRGGLRPEIAARVPLVEVLPDVDSTNALLLRRAQPGGADHVQVCLAEWQSAGRGRRGRAWVSPFGHNIYMSLLFTFDAGAVALSGLSLVAGLAVAEALQASGVRDVGLKWPNDIYCQERKAGGILLEIAGDPQSRCHVVVGVGLNLKARGQDMSEVTQQWTDLASQGVDPGRRNHLVAQLLNALVAAVSEFQTQGFAVFLPRWQRLDLSRERALEVLPGGAEAVCGIGQGVDADGALLVATPQGLRKFHGGEVSLRLRAREEM
ncbi:MAG: bifunctional biotin--[acetyl-CoA-carboxylase] ligase/biotin operon repressor BirA [Pseudomonadales bacterium]|jgi:BirA family biotin operon repressor/biotin-[acetyl-CoA-carboxylase] ligase|nr:bifunctional biotin--[acetyl-CoA-carboxylase] ligase/biotin operon repressor BirA [Pseudomonadales bacterium]